MSLWDCGYDGGASDIDGDGLGLGDEITAAICGGVLPADQVTVRATARRDHIRGHGDGDGPDAKSGGKGKSDNLGGRRIIKTKSLKVSEHGKHRTALVI